MKKGWEIKKLGDVCAFVRGPFGGSLKKNIFKQDGYAVYEQQHAIYNQFSDIRYFIDEHKFNEMKRFELHSGDLIMSCSGTMGKIAIVPKNFKKGIINQALLKLSPSREISNVFLKLYMQSEAFQDELRKYSQGAAIQNVASVAILKKIDIPLPKLSEQKEIVAILDKVFSNISKARENAEQNLKSAKELFESHLQEVFENKRDAWVDTTIGEICNLQTGGTPSTSRKEYYEGGNIKWLVSGDVNKKNISDCEGRITELGMNNSNTKYLPINSVLIALNGQGKTRGTVAMLRTKATCNQSLVSIYPKDEKSLLPELVYLNLEGRYEEIRKMTGDSGNDRRGLNMPLIRGIKFSYPKNINEQKKIIKKLNDLRTNIDKLEMIYKQKINDLEDLKKSVLHKAFNGELKKC